MDSRGSRRWLSAVRYSRDLDLRRPRAGHVLSVHRSALNVVADGDLIVVARAAGGGLPGGILVDDRFDPLADGVRVGMSVRFERDLWIGSRLAISLGEARPWSASLHAVGPLALDLGPRLDALEATLDRQGGNGFAVMASDSALPAAFADAARWGGTGRAGDRLIGLGAGLTPAGDDLLVGFSAALTAIGHPAARPLAGRWADRAGEATTLIAAAYHRHAAAGRYAERLQDAIGAILRGPLDEIPAAVELGCRFGATSGVDLLTGVQLGLRAGRNLHVERAA